ncbi:linear amide C-N hydrolase [Winogradskyella sp.]|uniref:linear amide C-N hydrolase n=1 Tax=Winogradskyella sp. TaxID=1883156 RepID=UPI003BACF21A
MLKRNLLIILTIIIAVPKVNACTSFCFSKNGKHYFGKNYDWFAESGMIIINHKGLSKTSEVRKDGNTISWVSKYGSVTFNQYGKEFPSGGMNEKGLVIELMWLSETQYPKKDKRASLDELQWIQYQLDNSATIEDVINSDKLIRITSNGVPLHFLVADTSGNTTTIEFLNGKLVAHTKKNIPFSVLTNSTYKKSLNETVKNTAQKLEKPSFKANSFSRFATACKMIDNFKRNEKGNSIKAAFNILNKVKQGSFTKWSIVYDICERKIYFKSFSSNQLKNLEFDSINFNCTAAPLCIELDTDFKGNINNKLKVFNNRINALVLEKSIQQSARQIKLNESFKKRRLKYIEHIKCH